MPERAWYYLLTISLHLSYWWVNKLNVFMGHAASASQEHVHFDFVVQHLSSRTQYVLQMG